MPSFVYTLLTGGLILGLLMAYAHWSKRRELLRAPRITANELNGFQARLEAASLPRVRLIPSDVPPSGAAASRLGGAPYADSKSRRWPVRGDGKHPMLFVAQLNFAELPPIEDFPTKGLLQLFVLADQKGYIQGTDRKTDRVIRWFPDPVGELTIPLPDALAALRKRTTFSQRFMREGTGLSYEPDVMPAQDSNWPYNTEFNSHMRLPENEEVELQHNKWVQATEERLEKEATWHWVGGHPNFVQVDIRHEPRLRKLNRVLLHLTSDDTDINFGDTGELNLMISRKALRNHSFDEAFCTWDCC